VTVLRERERDNRLFAVNNQNNYKTRREKEQKQNEKIKQQQHHKQLVQDFFLSRTQTFLQVFCKCFQICKNIITILLMICFGKNRVFFI
jgi:hypothetical protein